MIKMIATACRRPGMTHAEYLAYIQHVHGAISNENPVTLRRYVQNHVFDSAFGTTAQSAHSLVVSRDSVTELYWDSPQEMGATFQHEHVRTKVGPDGPNFADTGVMLSMVAHEVEQSVLRPGRGSGAKVPNLLVVGFDSSIFLDAVVCGGDVQCLGQCAMTSPNLDGGLALDAASKEITQLLSGKAVQTVAYAEQQALLCGGLGKDARWDHTESAVAVEQQRGDVSDAC
jgi:hypothetical protein